MTTKQRTVLKKQLLSECRRVQQLKADNARQAMLDVQESAKESQGAIEDKFESFREACQIQRDLFARQLDEALNGLQALQRVPEARPPKNQPGVGTVVVTDSQRFYISVSLGEIKVDGTPYFAISAFSPLYQAMAQSRVGETFSFRGKPYRIEEVF
ncbi:hypothetical protein [Hymenobacter chitinivorans]|uniref:Transcription elongation GreA/GreB family factor n=1 Tax=Hymenobacter chitinivorans DSM 11115 TaxID=1121954 RepID=A0A2M9BQP0_9BACT|nr:hypothetical protein [Hymenobacter chitinivorans]PJJ60259.1 hypothetical protein CLV45_1684 [Hymenobacter chitinivorans DSM 11115]